MLNALLVGLAASLFAIAPAFGDDAAKPGPSSDKAAKPAHEHHHAAPPPPNDKKGDMASMSRTPAPKTGSMPKGDAPKGKLGTEPTAKGRLGTDPKPEDGGSKPPRLN